MVSNCRHVLDVDEIEIYKGLHIRKMNYGQVNEWVPIKLSVADMRTAYGERVSKFITAMVMLGIVDFELAKGQPGLGRCKEN